MKIKFPILLFIFGIFLFLLPNFAEAACSALNYPVNKWQRVWYKITDTSGTFGTCYGDGPDEYGCPDESSSIGIDTIDFDNNWGLTGSPGGYSTGQVGFTSSRTIFINPAGTYRFYLGSDDGSRLYIDGSLKIDLWYEGSWKEASVDVSLSKGTHQFRIDYYEWGGSNGVKFTQTRLTSGAHCEWYGPGWGGGIGHFYCGTDAGTGICGYFNSSSGTGGYSVCLIGQQCELASTSGDSCGTTDTVCQREKCPSYSSKNGESCRVERNDCTSYIVPGNLYSVTSYGVWDAADFKCVQCNYTTKKESAVCGSSTGIYQTCDFAQRRSAACTGTSDTQCESACGASSDCDEKAVGDSCGTGKTCDSSCQCVTVCTRAAPSVTATNSPQTGNPGDTKTFTFNITSNDTTVCSSSTFNLTKSCPSGWTCTLNKTSVTISPGLTDSTVTLSVTSPSTATVGDYTVTVNATNSVGGYVGSGNAIYKIVCTRVNPTVTATNSPQSGNPGDTKTFTFNITNNDTVACGSSIFNLTNPSCPSGWTCTLNKTSVTISPGSTDSTVTLSVTSPSTATAGNYTVSVRATNSGATSYSGTGSATYTVVVACTRVNPTVTPTNSPQSGNPGDTKTFTFNITNNDTTACGSSIFNLTKSCPSGWTCTLNKTSVTISPGSTDSTVTLSVTSPSTATAGNYTVSVIATNSGATSYSGTGSATYTVVVACTRANPGVSISPSSQSGTPGQTLSYTATIINYDSSGCGSSTFNLTKSCPSGWTCNLSSSSITISPNGSSGAVSLSVTSSATATDGNYTVSVTATNSGATSYSGTGNATYIVTVSGAGINPPIVTTKQATSVTQTSATLNGTLDSLGYDSAACPSCSCIVWFEWGTTGTAGVSGSYGNKTTPVEMAAFGSITPVTISGLTSGQTYYFEAFAKNGGSW